LSPKAEALLSRTLSQD